MPEATLSDAVDACPDSQVLTKVHGSVVSIILNRPKALNSLNVNMVTLMNDCLSRWRSHADVNCFILKGTGPKAFCAGGDVKSAVLDAASGRADLAINFFRIEYALINTIARLRKPFVSLLDGVVMGGGAGISINGRFRVATEQALFAMPECNIGLFTDVAGAKFLTDIPGHLGTYLALTGARLRGRELKQAGLATHYVPSASLPQLEAALTAGGAALHSEATVNATIIAFEESPEAADDVSSDKAAIDSCFGCDTVEGIYAAVQALQTPWAEATLLALQKGSPLSQKVTLEALRRAPGQPLHEVLSTDFRIVCRMVASDSDFAEGVRAMLVDRDGKPAWCPTSLQQVTPERVAEFFAPLPEGEELSFPDEANNSVSKL